jgi:hypothetical protein
MRCSWKFYFKLKQKESDFFLKTQLHQYFKEFKQQIDVLIMPTLLSSSLKLKFSFLYLVDLAQHKKR